MAGDTHHPVIAPFVEVLIGDINLSLPANYVKSFEYTEVAAADSGHSFSIDFFDPTWGLLDVILASNTFLPESRKLRFRWGTIHQMSDYRYGMITSSQPGQITRAGVHIRIEGTDLGSAAPESQIKKTRTHQGPISAIAAKIASEHKWKTDIEKTTSLLEEDGRSGEEREKTFRQDNQTDLGFLSELSKKAKAKDRPSAGPYLLYFDTKDEQPIMHFHPSRASFQKPRPYVVYSDRLGVVKSFSPELQGTALYAEGISALEVKYRDKQTKESMVLDYDAKEFSKGHSDGKYLAVEEGQISTKELPGFTVEEAVNYMDSYYARLSELTIPATMELEGDPTLTPDYYVKVVVLTPQNKKYFTSGHYLIKSVHHQIEAGEYATTLELVKNSLDEGSVRKDKVSSSVQTLSSSQIAAKQ